MMQWHVNQALINKHWQKWVLVYGALWQNQKKKKKGSFHTFMFSSNIVHIQKNMNVFQLWDEEGDVGNAAIHPSASRVAWRLAADVILLRSHTLKVGTDPNECWNHNLVIKALIHELAQTGTFCTNWGFTVISWSMDFSFSSNSIHFSICIRVKDR